MQEKYDTEPAKRNLQMESIAHITVERDMEKRLQEEPDINITGREFLCHIHREFYKRLPEEFLIVKDPDTGSERRVVPGALRKEAVKVGRHLPPEKGQ